MAVLTMFFRNWSNNDTTKVTNSDVTTTVPPPTNVNGSDFSKPGYDFSEWNSQSDGTGTKYNIGSVVSRGTRLYAIWSGTPDIDITYKDDYIGSTSSSKTLTLETAGKYCEGDIKITYVKPGGGGVSVSQDPTTNIITIS